ncbi:MAG: serine hydrolase [Ignavibacteriae bacterium]|nr:MAG: serine hydrolase [Ignavibacteriota bacterium]
MYFPPLQGGAWETVSADELGWCTENLDSLYAFLDRNGTKAFLVLKDGKIAIEWYADQFEQTDTWYWASAAKTVTATLVGIARRNGDLELSDRSSRFLGEGWSSLTKAQEDKITIRHHLTMTTGLDDGVDDVDCTVDTCLLYKADAGTRWAYHNAPYTLLDKVINRATGSSLNIYYSKKLREPIGMDGVFVKQGFNNVLISTPRSMARFGLLAMNNFVWDGTPILDDENYVRAMLNTSQDLNQSYGYLWWLNGKSSFMIPSLQLVFPGPLMPNAPSDAVNALGKNNQILSVVPSEGLVVVRMGDAAGEDGSLVPTVFPNNMWAALRKVICNISSVREGAGSSEQRAASMIISNGLLQLPEGQRSDVEVYDVTGVLRLRLSDVAVFDVSALSTGVYVMRIAGTEQPTMLLITSQ